MILVSQTTRVQRRRKKEFCAVPAGLRDAGRVYYITVITGTCPRLGVLESWDQESVVKKSVRPANTKYQMPSRFPLTHLLVLVWPARRKDW